MQYKTAFAFVVNTKSSVKLGFLVNKHFIFILRFVFTVLQRILDTVLANTTSKKNDIQLIFLNAGSIPDYFVNGREKLDGKTIRFNSVSFGVR